MFFKLTEILQTCFDLFTALCIQTPQNTGTLGNIYCTQSSIMNYTVVNLGNNQYLCHPCSGLCHGELLFLLPLQYYVHEPVYGLFFTARINANFTVVNYKDFTDKKGKMKHVALAAVPRLSSKDTFLQNIFHHDFDYKLDS